MDPIFTVFSLSGVLQGLILSVIIVVRDRKAEINRWLSGLFLLLSLVILDITLANSGLSVRQPGLETMEFAATFLGGPLLFIIARKLMDRPDISPALLAVHFVPFAGYLLLVLLTEVNVPVFVPLIHLQVYTLWLVFRLTVSGVGNRSSRTWLVLLAAFLIFMHLGQWVRYSFASVKELELLVPLAAGAGFYLLTVYGLVTSKLFAFTRKYRGIDLPEDQLQENVRKIEQLMNEEQCFRDPDLSLDSLAGKMDIHPNRLSHIINGSFGVGFNEFVNTRRVEAVKRYLTDNSKDHYTIEALGREAGFNSRSSFYAAFRKATGTTPSSYNAD